LKAWLYEHIKNPYPTKGEKIMLAIITKMTLTQVPLVQSTATQRTNIFIFIHHIVVAANKHNKET